MEKEPMGKFVPCICTIEGMHMPAISVVTAGDNRHTPEILIESVRVDYKTQDPASAYQQALQDYHNAAAESNSIADLNQRIKSIVSRLRQKGYVLTPKTIQTLIFNAASPEVVH